MTTHYLKTREPWYSRVVAEEKTVEIRAHDRDFQVSDRLVLVRTLHELSASAEQLLEQENPDRRAIVVEVMHVAPSSLVDGLIAGYCALSIRLVGNHEQVPA
jgi:hypothetical protein